MDVREGKKREKSRKEKPQSKIWMQEKERGEKSPEKRSRGTHFGCRRRKEEKKVQKREVAELILDAGERKEKVRKARRNKARIGLYIIKKNN